MSRLHAHLMALVIVKPEDYDEVPGGEVIRWSDPKQAYPDCSGGCKWYLTLEGRLGMDWGVCANKESHRAGLLTFEHQGCQKFELSHDPTDGEEDEEGE